MWGPVGLYTLHTRKVALPLPIKELLKQTIQLNPSNVKIAISKFQGNWSQNLVPCCIQVNGLCSIDSKPKISVCSTGLPLEIIGHCRMGFLSHGSINNQTKWYFVAGTVLCILGCLAAFLASIHQYLPPNQSWDSQKWHCQVFPGEQNQWTTVLDSSSFWDFTVDKESLLKQPLVRLPWILFLTRSHPWTLPLAPLVQFLQEFYWLSSVKTLHPWYVMKWLTFHPWYLTYSWYLFKFLILHPQYVISLVYLQQKSCQVGLARVCLTRHISFQ